MTAPPLAGVRVVVTRAAHQSEPLCEALARRGARVERLPLIEVVPPADPRPLERAASELALYDWLAFTSANAVEAFLPATGGALPARLKVAAVGTATAAALAGWEIEPDLLPDPSTATGLVQALAPRVSRRQRVLVPRAADALPTLVDGLLAAGAEPVAVTVYDKRLPEEAPARAAALFGEGELGWVTVTSPRIARHLRRVMEAMSLDGSGLRAASIGPVTDAALRQLGWEPAATAERPSAEELAEAIERAARG